MSSAAELSRPALQGPPAFLDLASTHRCSPSEWTLLKEVWSELIKHHERTGHIRAPLSVRDLSELMAPYGYDRGTVKKAKARLLEAGIIDRIPGTRRYPTDLIGIPGLFESAEERPRTPRVTRCNGSVLHTQAFSKTDRRNSSPSPAPSNLANEQRDTTLTSMAQQRWSRAKRALEESLEAEEYATWIDPLTLDEGTDQVVLRAPNDLVAESAGTTYRSAIVDACQEAGLPTKLRVHAGESKPASASDHRHRSPSAHQPSPPGPPGGRGQRRLVTKRQLLRAYAAVDGYYKTSKTRPTEPPESVFRWIIYQIVFGASSDDQKWTFEEALSGIMKLVQQRRFNRPRGFQSEAVEEHWKAISEHVRVQFSHD